MSWVKKLICDSCKKILPEHDEYKYRTMLRHTCEECQIKEHGFFLGDEKEMNFLKVAQTKGAR